MKQPEIKKIEIWKCVECGKETELRPKTNYKFWRIREPCSCGGKWKFKEIKRS